MSAYKAILTTLVNEMVRLSCVSIEFQSQHGIGSKFTVLLPITDKAIKEVPVGITPDLSDATSDADTDFSGYDDNARAEGLPLILLVGDNTDVIDYIGICIQHEYRLITASQGMKES